MFKKLSPFVVESSPYSPKDTDEDDPYVPGDPGSYSKPSSIASSVLATSTKPSVMIHGSTSTELTVAMLAAITTNPKVSEQKRLLLELTKKVELQKKLLEQRKQQNLQELAPLLIGKEAALLQGNFPKATMIVAKNEVNYPLPPVERQPTPPPLPTTSMPSTTTTTVPLPPISESSAVSSVITTGVTNETDIVALTRNLVSGKEQAPTSVLPKTTIASVMSASDSAAVAMTLSLVAGDDKSKASQLPSPLKSLFANMSQKQSSSVAGATALSDASPIASQQMDMSTPGQQTMISPSSVIAMSTTAMVSSTTLFQPPGSGLLQPSDLFPPPVPAIATQPLITKPEDSSGTIMENLKTFTSESSMLSSTDTFKPPVRKSQDRPDSPVFEVVTPKSRKTDGKAQIQIKFASLSGSTDAPLQGGPNVVNKSDSNVIPMISPDSTQAADTKEGDKRKGSSNIASKVKSKGPEISYQDNLPKIPGFGSDDEVGSSALSFLRKPWEMPTSSDIEEKQNITSLFDNTNATGQPKSGADIKTSESADIAKDSDAPPSGFGDIDERVIPVQHQQDIDYRQQPHLMHQTAAMLPAFQQADSTQSPEGDAASHKFTQDVDHRRLPPSIGQHEAPRPLNPNAPFSAAPLVQHIIGSPRPPGNIPPQRASLLPPSGNVRPPMMNRFPPDQRPGAPLRGRPPMPDQLRMPLRPQMVRGPLIRGQPPRPEWRPPPRPEMRPEFQSHPMMPRPPFTGPILDSSRHPLPMEPPKPMDQDMRAAPSRVEGFPVTLGVAPQFHPRPQFVPGLVRPDPPHNAENSSAMFLGDIDERVRASSPKSDSTGSPLIDEPLMNVSQVHPESQKDGSQKDTTNTSSESGAVSNITVVSTVPSILDVKSAHEVLVDDPLGSVEVMCSRDLSARLAKRLRENNEPKKEEKDRKRTHSREDSSTSDRRSQDDAKADDNGYKRRRSEDRYSRQDSDRHRNRSRNSPSRHRNSPSRRRDSYRDDLRNRSDSDRDRRRSDRRSDERDRRSDDRDRDRHYDDRDRRSDDRDRRSDDKDRRSDDRRSSRSDSDSRRRGYRS